MTQAHPPIPIRGKPDSAGVPAKPARTSRFGGRGFTLTELLVVIAIMALLLSLGFPMLLALQRSTRGGAGESSVEIALKVARAYATQSVGDLKTTSSNANFSNAVYSGAGAIFAPDGQIRLIQNNLAGQGAMTLSPSVPLEPNRIGFVDIANVDYIRLPSTTGVVGIAYGDGGQLLLLAPPFAVRFNKYGQLVAGTDDSTASPTPPPSSRLLYYDGNYDGYYDITSKRLSAGTYNPDLWDPRITSGLVPQQGTGKFPLPFEEIETVVGVLVFDRTNFQSAHLNLQTNGVNRALNTAAQNYLLTPDPTDSNKLLYAKAMFFSRYAGTLMRESVQ